MLGELSRYWRFTWAFCYVTFFLLPLGFLCILLAITACTV